MHKPKKTYTNAVGHDIYQLCCIVSKVAMFVNCQVFLQESNKPYGLLKGLDEAKVAVIGDCMVIKYNW